MGDVRIGVVGAGVSGLSAAYQLRRRLGDSAEIVVYESSPRPGGKLRTRPVPGLEGFSVDEGAEAFRRTAQMGELLRDLGLADRVAAPRSGQPLVYAGGARHPLPQGTLMGIPTDVAALRGSSLLDAAALERVAQEADRPTGEPVLGSGEDVAVGALVRDRLGPLVLDRLVGPLLAGVYAGDADQLSVRATLPGLAEALESQSSLVRAAGEALRTARRSGSMPGTGLAAADAPAFVTLLGGLEPMVLALVGASRATLRTGLPVREIRPRSSATGGSLSRWTIVAGSASEIGPSSVEDVDAVVLATPGTPAARLLQAHLPATAQALSELRYASVAVVTLAYRDVELPAGSGVLVAVGEGREIKAATFTTQKWPYDRSHGLPDGVTVLRASLGRAGDAAVLQRTDGELARVVAADVAAVTPIASEPFAFRVSRWGGALPQYPPGHVQRVEQLRRDVAGLPGVAVCGAAYDGVGIPACVSSGMRAADEVVAAL